MRAESAHEELAVRARLALRHHPHGRHRRRGDQRSDAVAQPEQAVDEHQAAARHRVALSRAVDPVADAVGSALDDRGLEPGVDEPAQDARLARHLGQVGARLVALDPVAHDLADSEVADPRAHRGRSRAW